MELVWRDHIHDWTLHFCRPNHIPNRQYGHDTCLHSAIPSHSFATNCFQFSNAARPSALPQLRCWKISPVFVPKSLNLQPVANNFINISSIRCHLGRHCNLQSAPNFHSQFLWGICGNNFRVWWMLAFLAIGGHASGFSCSPPPIYPGFCVAFSKSVMKHPQTKIGPSIS